MSIMLLENYNFLLILIILKAVTVLSDENKYNIKN